MKTERLLLPLLVALAALPFFTGCASGRIVRPTTPPTFVMAWTLDGPSGQVWTVESNDGIIWRNSAPQNLQGNLSGSNSGPAIAHDRNIAWMLMWPNPRGLDYKIGTGGVALSGQGGVVWEPQPHQGLLPFTAIGGSPAGSPALTFGHGRWVVAFRTSGTGDKIRVVRSQQNSATTWELARDMEVQTPSGLRSVVSQHDPAIAFGQGSFVLIHRGPTNFIASTSPDGISWTDRGPIAQIPEAC